MAPDGFDDVGRKFDGDVGDWDRHGGLSGARFDGLVFIGNVSELVGILHHVFSCGS